MNAVYLPDLISSYLLHTFARWISVTPRLPDNPDGVPRRDLGKVACPAGGGAMTVKSLGDYNPLVQGNSIGVGCYLIDGLWLYRVSTKYERCGRIGTP